MIYNEYNQPVKNNLEQILELAENDIKSHYDNILCAQKLRDTGDGKKDPNQTFRDKPPCW